MCLKISHAPNQNQKQTHKSAVDTLEINRQICSFSVKKDENHAPEGSIPVSTKSWKDKPPVTHKKGPPPSNSSSWTKACHRCPGQCWPSFLPGGDGIPPPYRQTKTPMFNSIVDFHSVHRIHPTWEGAKEKKKRVKTLSIPDGILSSATRNFLVTGTVRHDGTRGKVIFIS